MMSDTTLQTYCLGFRGKKEGAYLTCHCDEEAVHHKQEALLSFSPALFCPKSAWHACERAPPARRTPLRRMLAVR